jgi:ligand-binding sensor domain-containing protein
MPAENTPGSDLVKTLIRDNNNRIWIGMHGGGINVLDANRQKLKQFNSRQAVNAINSDDVISLLLDNKNCVWIGTEENDVDVYNITTDKVEKFETLCPDKHLAIICLFKDSKQNIWIGTRQGLSRLQADGKELNNFLKYNAPGESQSDYINCLAEDKDGRIWVWTYSGLSFYDPHKNLFGTYTPANGLAGSKVVGIVADNNNNLWISTNSGLSYLDSSRKQFHSFTVDDGLPGNFFNYNSFFKDRTGYLFFGG